MKEIKNKSNNFIVYKAENTQNGYVYIGATKKSIEERKKDHEQKANKGQRNKFQEAISTYGAEAFSWEEVDTASSSDELAQKEIQYILEYNSNIDGYNADSGGGIKKTVYQYDLDDGRLVEKYDCLENAANSVSTTKQHISRACLSVNKTYAGFYWSYEYKEPFKTIIDCRKKEVLQYSLVGDLLAKYDSVSKASRQTGISKTCISRVCRRERKNSGGFIWSYK